MRDGPVPGQVQVEVDRRGRGQQLGAGHPQAEPLWLTRPPQGAAGKYAYGHHLLRFPFTCARPRADSAR